MATCAFGQYQYHTYWAGVSWNYYEANTAEGACQALSAASGSASYLFTSPATTPATDGIAIGDGYRCVPADDNWTGDIFQVCTPASETPSEGGIDPTWAIVVCFLVLLYAVGYSTGKKA